jgi:hypothetical protein
MIAGCRDFSKENRSGTLAGGYTRCYTVSGIRQTVQVGDLRDFTVQIAQARKPSLSMIAALPGNDSFPKALRWWTTSGDALDG